MKQYLTAYDILASPDRAVTIHVVAVFPPNRHFIWASVLEAFTMVARLEYRITSNQVPVQGILQCGPVRQ